MPGENEVLNSSRSNLDFSSKLKKKSSKCSNRNNVNQDEGFLKTSWIDKFKVKKLYKLLFASFQQKKNNKKTSVVSIN
jgi:hypothetical protein